MKRLSLNKDGNRDRVLDTVTVIGLIAIIFYILVSLRNLIQIVLNFSLLSAHSGITGIIFNVILYLFVIATGVEAIRRSKNPYYIIIALVTILIIY